MMSFKGEIYEIDEEKSESFNLFTAEPTANTAHTEVCWLSFNGAENEKKTPRNRDIDQIEVTS